jgi:hypothetical protein
MHRLFIIRLSGGWTPGTLSPRSGLGMSLTGTLRDLSLVNLVQLQCGERQHAQVSLVCGGCEGRLIFADGELVFASVGDLTGEGAVQELLRWDDAEFLVDHERVTVTRNIHGPWPALFLEGARRVDEARALHDGRLEASLRSLRGTHGLRTAVLVSDTGHVRAAATEERAPQAAALISFVAGRLETVAAALNSGPLGEVLLTAPTEAVWILKKDGSYLACWLTGRAALNPVAALLQPLFICDQTVAGGQTTDGASRRQYAGGRDDSPKGASAL